MILSILAFAISLMQTPAQKPAFKDTRVFELRVYTAAAGKLDDLHSRFRDHTIEFFRKHGLTSVGYWVPVDNKENKLYYILAAPNREAHDRSFKELGEDPDFQAMFKASEANGKLVDKIESTLLTATDYSPVVKPALRAGAPGAASARTFELRTYHTTAGKLPDLNARFRDHTMALFERHGIKNIAYWTPVDKDKGSEDTLIYLIAHKDPDAAKKSWAEFGADPEWQAAKAESEKNGKLVEKVESVYLKPTDYSLLR